MTTVRQVSASVQGIIDELTILTASITNSFNNMNTRASTSKAQDNDILTQSTIKNLKDQADMVDRKFEEAEYKVQASGGKSRKQTLQEFVILFFFVAYAAFTISLVLYSKATGKSVLKTLGTMAFILLIIVGIIIRYA